MTTVARTAADHGAHVRTRARVLTATGTGVELRDELTGGTATVSARAVVNATGVWAGDLVEEVTLRPSRGTHLVLRAETLPGLRVAVTAHVPGHTNRFVMVLPQPDGTLYVGLTDEPVEGEIPDVPEPSEAEIGFLLDVVSAAFAHDVRRSDVVGAYAGLRPLLDTSRTEGAGTDRRPVPQARRAHLAQRRGDGRRRQADDVPADGRGRRRRRPGRRRPRRRALPHPHPPAGRRRVPRPSWPGSSCRPGWSAATAPTRRWSSSPPARSAGWPTTSCSRRSPTACRSTLAELLFGVTHEGAADVDDLLDRRTRIGLVPADRERGRTGRRAGARRWCAPGPTDHGNLALPTP